MVNTSEQFLYEITKTSRNESRIEGYFVKKDSSVVLFNSDNIANGTLKISKKSVSKTYFNIGEAYIDMAKLTLIVDDSNDWKGLVDSEMTISFTILDDSGEELTCALGTWDILSDGVTRKLSSVEFTGDSLMNRLDAQLETQLNGTPFELVTYACAECNVPFSMTELEFSLLPNSGYTYYASDLSKVKTYRDLVMWVSQILCGYCTMSMSGGFEIRSYYTTATATMRVFTPNSDTILSSEVGDYTYNLTGLMMTVDGNIFSSGEIGVGNYIELESNPLLLSGTDDFRQIVVSNLYSVLSLMDFKSFKLSYNGNPSVECGDTLIIQDRDLSCPIQSHEWVFRGKSTVIGYIPDTASDVSSQSVKNSTTSKGSAGSKLTISRYRNATALTIGQVYTQVATIMFSTPEVTTPLMLFSVKFALSESCDVSVKFIYDNVTLDFDPKYTLLQGFFTIDFSNAVNQSVAGSDHTLIVEMLCSSGELSADVNDCMLSIYGYGVEGGGSNFSGYLTLSEKFNLLNGVTSDLSIGSFSDSISESLF